MSQPSIKIPWNYYCRLSNSVAVVAETWIIARERLCASASSVSSEGEVPTARPSQDQAKAPKKKEKEDEEESSVLTARLPPTEGRKILKWSFRWNKSLVQSRCSMILVVEMKILGGCANVHSGVFGVKWSVFSVLLDRSCVLKCTVLQKWVGGENSTEVLLRKSNIRMFLKCTMLQKLQQIKSMEVPSWTG